LVAVPAEPIDKIDPRLAIDANTLSTTMVILAPVTSAYA
jgi:hypothetical protein